MRERPTLCGICERDGVAASCLEQSNCHDIVDAYDAGAHKANDAANRIAGRCADVTRQRDSETERANALAHVLQPLLAADLEDLARELRWEGGPIAHEAAQLLEDTLEQAKRHGVIDDGSDQDAGSENEWNRATPLGSLAEATRARGQQQ